MIFQYTLPQVLSGRKQQTRRAIRQGDVAVRGANNQIVAVVHNGREKWRVGNTYAVQPARGASQVARIKIVGINSEQVKRIRPSDVIAEGFETRKEFLDTWKQIHGEGYQEIRVWVIKFELDSPPLDSGTVFTLGIDAAKLESLVSNDDYQRLGYSWSSVSRTT